MKRETAAWLVGLWGDDAVTMREYQGSRAHSSWAVVLPTVDLFALLTEAGFDAGRMQATPQCIDIASWRMFELGHLIADNLGAVTVLY